MITFSICDIIILFLVVGLINLLFYLMTFYKIEKLHYKINYLIYVIKRDKIIKYEEYLMNEESKEE